MESVLKELDHEIQYLERTSRTSSLPELPPIFDTHPQEIHTLRWQLQQLENDSDWPDEWLNEY